MELAERIAGRAAELTGEVELLRKQLADAEHELERLVITGQVIAQLTSGDAAAAGAPDAAGPAPRGFGLLVLPRSQASGPGDLPGDYRSLVEAVAAAAGRTRRDRPPERERPRQAQAAGRPRLAAPQRGRQVRHRALT